MRFNFIFDIHYQIFDFVFSTVIPFLSYAQANFLYLILFFCCPRYLIVKLELLYLYSSLLMWPVLADTNWHYLAMVGTHYYWILCLNLIIFLFSLGNCSSSNYNSIIDLIIHVQDEVILKSRILLRKNRTQTSIKWTEICNLWTVVLVDCVMKAKFRT